MPCIKEIKIKGVEVDSQLQPEILKIMKNNPHLALDEVNSLLDESEELYSIDELKEHHYEDAAGLMYNYFTDPEFIDEFGDWQNVDITDNTYSNGEPKLFFDKNLKKHYYRNKFGDKTYFPLTDNGLSYIYDLETIDEAVKYIGYRFFQVNFNKDYSDLSFLANENIEDSIRQIILGKINEYNNTDKQDIADELRDSLYYLPEWTNKVKNYFNSLGFKLKDVIDTEQEDNSTATRESFRKASFEQDSKNAISANIKAFLSFIPNPEQIDGAFEESGFVEFEDIYNTLQSGLSDISPTIRDTNIEDTFNIMVDRIGELAHRKPYLKELLNILNHPTLTDEKKSEFTQAFSLVKNPYFVTEIDFKKAGISYSNKDVSNVNANYNVIQREWGYNFEELFLKDGTLNTDKVNKISDDLKKVAIQVNELQKTIVEPSEINQAVNSLVDVLRNIGVETTEKAFNSHIGNVADVAIDIDEMLNKIKATIKNLYRFPKGLKKTKSFYTKNGSFINPLKSESIFQELAKEEAFFKPDGGDASIFSAGKSYWVYSLPSHIAGEVNKWKSNITELEDLYNSDYSSGSKILQYLLAKDSNYGNEQERYKIARQRIKDYKIGIFNALQDKKTQFKKADPKGNTEVSKNDAIIDNINRALLAKKGEKSLFNTPTPADKATSYLMSHGYFMNSNIQSLDSDGNPVLSQEVVDTFYDYFSAEYDRMYKASITIKDPSTTKQVYYHASKSGDIYKGGKVVGNAFKSQLFEGLSYNKIGSVIPEIADLIYNEDGTAALSSLDEFSEPIKAYINSILSKSITNKLEQLVDIGIVQRTDANDKFTIAVDNIIMNNYTQESKFPTYNAVADYHINTIINTYEYSKMFSGDPAYYKNMVDYAKRIPATYTDGMQLRLLNDDDLTFNAAIVAGVEVGSKYMDILKELMGDVAEEYYGDGKINTTDAQAWITPKRWEFLVRRLGKWTDYHESALPKILGESKEPFSPKELKAVAQPLKGVYFKLNNGVPTYLKYSQAVLLPEVVQGTDMQRLYDKMIANDIDETITLDGIKVGAPIPDVIHTKEGMLTDEFDLTPLELDNRGWKLQQDLPTKTFKDTDVGSQIQKNVLSGLAFNMDSKFILEGKEVDGKDIYQTINSITGALSQHGINDLMSEMNIDDTGKINNIKGLYDLLLKEAEKRNINSNLIDALRKEISIYGIPQSHSKLMNMFFSIVKDRIVKIKTNGGSYIQISNFGIDKLTPNQKQGIKWFIDPEKGLKPPHIVDGKIKPGQILLSGSLIAKAIPNWKDLSPTELKSKIDPKILENVIGYRIPNQGLSSNDSLEIVGFLPEGMGDSVIAYGEIPTKTGSDFDIDKMFMMVPTFSKDDNGNLTYENFDESKSINEQTVGALQNRLIESYKAVFTHPEVIKDVMTPIDFEYIKTDITTIFKDSKNKPDLYHFDSINQINLKYDFLAGKAGVGQTANMLVDHVRGMFINGSLINTFIEGSHTNDIGDTLFDREYSKSLSNEESTYISNKLNIPISEVSSYKISHSISAFLNAFVDIAKDPYVTRGNWTTQTSNTGFMMLRAGIHPFIVNRFIGQPIIREYIDFVINAESKYKNEKGDIRELFLKSNNIKIENYNNNDILSKSLIFFDKAIKSNDKVTQSKIITKFFELQDLSKNLIKSINASKPDVSAAGKDLSSRFIIENSIKDLNENEKVNMKGHFRGFNDKLIDPTTNEPTILGHYINNSVNWINKVIKNNPKIFLMGNPNIEKSFNVISKQLRGSRLTSQLIADEIYKNYYTYLMSGYDGLKLEGAPRKLFIDFPKEIIKAKINPELEDNFFIQQLEIKKDGLTFIRLQNKKRSKNTQNRLYRGWKMLMDEKPELAKNLIRYSFYSTGFQNSINEFFSHIPHEYFVENKLNQFIYETSREITDVQYEFIDQFYRHNHDNSLIVPNTPKKQSKVLVKNISFARFNDKKIELPLYSTLNDKLAKLQGYNKDGTGIYTYINKLGFSKESGSVIEYNYDNKVLKSKFPSNNVENQKDIDNYNSKLTLFAAPGEYDVVFKEYKFVDVNTLNDIENQFNKLFDDVNAEIKAAEINNKINEFNKDCE